MNLASEIGRHYSKAVFAPKSFPRGKVMAMSATTDDIIEKMKTLTLLEVRRAPQPRLL